MYQKFWSRMRGDLSTLVNVALCTIIIGERETTCQPSMLLHIYAD